jgi:hypothetical protein
MPHHGFWYHIGYLLMSRGALRWFDSIQTHGVRILDFLTKIKLNIFENWGPFLVLLEKSFHLHLISYSFHLQSSGELSSLSSIELQGDVRHKA